MNPNDLMDVHEVAEAFGVTTSSVRVAQSQPDKYPALANRMPAPVRRIGRSYVWSRADVEAALEAAE